MLLPWTALKNSLALLITHFLVWNFSIACHFRVAPTPSMGPLPWLVALKFHDNFTLCFADSIGIDVITYWFLNWLAGPSVHILMCLTSSGVLLKIWSVKETMVDLLCWHVSLIMTYGMIWTMKQKCTVSPGLDSNGLIVLHLVLYLCNFLHNPFEKTYWVFLLCFNFIKFILFCLFSFDKTMRKKCICNSFCISVKFKSAHWCIVGLVCTKLASKPYFF